MQRSCKQCNLPFEITPGDLAFYDKVSPVFAGKKIALPSPTFCPTCRAQRRQAQFNYEFLYKRKSDKTGKEIVSAFSADKPFVVYEPSEWWSDNWNSMDYGVDYDPTQPFFTQFKTLQRKVPAMALVVDMQSNQNSEYVQYSGWDKNCYLCFCTDYSEDCMYTHSVYYSKNTADCFLCQTVELCYECVYCNECYHLLFSQNCHNCNDGAFLYDCRGCKNCFGCVGLRNKEFCFFNEQLTKDEYQKRIAAYPLQRMQSIKKTMAETQPLLRKHPRLAFIGINNEGVTGDYLFNCKDCRECYDCQDLRDSAFCNSMRGGNDCYDISHWGHPGELCYDCGGVGEGATHLLFCNCCWPGCVDLMYCNLCISCHDCFGCVGLRHKSYCIFNKQYPKEEYEKLVPRILADMSKRGEWGEFFPVTDSPFCYNESVSQKYYPLSKEEILSRGWQWKDPENQILHVTKTIPAAQLPDSLDDIPDDVLNWAITCEVTGRPFKIVKQELAFYRTMKLPIPRVHPDERLRLRMTRRNPRKFWLRQCAKCKKDIQTTYSSERPEIVYCEECYLKEVY